MDAAVNGIVGIAGAFGAELPDCPISAVFIVEKLNEGGERVTVSKGGVCSAGTRGGNDWLMSANCMPGVMIKLQLRLSIVAPANSMRGDSDGAFEAAYKGGGVATRRRRTVIGHVAEV